MVYVHFSSVLQLPQSLGVYSNFSRIRFFTWVLNEWRVLILMCLIVSVIEIMNWFINDFIIYTFYCIVRTKQYGGIADWSWWQAQQETLCVVTIAVICSTLASLWKFQYFRRPIYNPTEQLWWSFFVKIVNS